MKSVLNDPLEKYKGKKVLVIGDLMLDKYTYGKADRISPEAPVPVISVKEERYVPGGAANTAANITAMKGHAALIGVIGDDEAKGILISELEERLVDCSAIITDSSRRTTKKVRIVSRQQQIVRVDFEDTRDIAHETFEKVKEAVSSRIRHYGCIVISDYAKGLITKGLAEYIIAEASSAGIPVIADPKPKHALFYKGAALITPNQKEASEIASAASNGDMVKYDDYISIGNAIVNSIGADVLMTRGEEGMTLFQKKDGVIKVSDFETRAREVYDVSGAGDTVVAALALGFAAGVALEHSIAIANIAAGIKVGKAGTAAVSLEEIKGYG